MTRSHLGHIDLRFPREIAMMREAVLDIGTQHGSQSVHDLTGTGRPEDTQRLRNRTHHPLRRDYVVQVTDVIAVQMREEYRVEHDG